MYDKFIRAAKNHMYQLDNFSEEAVLGQIKQEFDDILSLNDNAVLEKRLAYIGIGRKEDYINQFIETREGTVLAGIRHMGGNPDKPFVYIWPSFKIMNLAKTIDEIRPYFEFFKPKSYHFWVRPDCNDYEVPVIQQRFITKIDDIVKYDLPLKLPSNYYDWYYNQYKIFHELRPDFVDRVTVNAKEVMDECLQQGLLFQLEIDEQIAGLIAGERELFLGQATVYIDEILVASEFRGKGYASKLLGSFANLLDAKYLTCHIDSENIASTKTALRAGEVVFSQECSVEYAV